MSADAAIYDESTLPVLLTVEETAALLRVSSSAVYDMVRRKQLPGARKIGGTIRVHRDTLMRFIVTGQGADK